MQWRDARPQLAVLGDRRRLVHAYSTRGDGPGIAPLLSALAASGLGYSDVETRESSLEDIFLDLVKSRR